MEYCSESLLASPSSKSVLLAIKIKLIWLSASKTAKLSPSPLEAPVTMAHAALMDDLPLGDKTDEGTVKNPMFEEVSHHE